MLLGCVFAFGFASPSFVLVQFCFAFCFALFLYGIFSLRFRMVLFHFLCFCIVLFGFVFTCDDCHFFGYIAPLRGVCLWKMKVLRGCFIFGFLFGKMCDTSNDSFNQSEVLRATEPSALF